MKSLVIIKAFITIGNKYYSQLNTYMNAQTNFKKNIRLETPSVVKLVNSKSLD